MGYYSLSSILISEYRQMALGAQLAAELGTIALLSNVFRELFTLVASPFLARKFGPFAPIASAGATAMDVSLPVILRSSGRQFSRRRGDKRCHLRLQRASAGFVFSARCPERLVFSRRALHFRAQAAFRESIRPARTLDRGRRLSEPHLSPGRAGGTMDACLICRRAPPVSASRVSYSSIFALSQPISLSIPAG